jgi:hypothetical protein
MNLFKSLSGVGKSTSWASTHAPQSAAIRVSDHYPTIMEFKNSTSPALRKAKIHPPVAVDNILWDGFLMANVFPRICRFEDLRLCGRW